MSGDVSTLTPAAVHGNLVRHPVNQPMLRKWVAIVSCCHGRRVWRIFGFCALAFDRVCHWSVECVHSPSRQLYGRTMLNVPACAGGRSTRQYRRLRARTIAAIDGVRKERLVGAKVQCLYVDCTSGVPAPLLAVETAAASAMGRMSKSWGAPRRTRSSALEGPEAASVLVAGPGRSCRARDGAAAGVPTLPKHIDGVRRDRIVSAVVSLANV